MSNDHPSNSRFELAGWTLLICLAIYFGLHVLTRNLYPNNLQLDEAELLVFTQEWAWGYGSQPPFYNWLQKAVIEVMGVNVLALSLLKNSLLWLFYFLFYLAAREVFTERRWAVLATATAIFMPQLAWESQRDQSHLVLATVCAAASLFLFLRICKGAGILTYLAFGIVAALGTLAKYNYIFFPLALLVAGLTSSMRGAILRPQTLLALIAFALVMSPHAQWVLDHKNLAASQTYKFKSVAGSTAYFTGMFSLAKASVLFFVVPTLLFSPFLFRRSPIQRDPWNKLLGRVFICAIAFCGALVLCFHVTNIRERWMQPLLFAYPIFLVGLAAPRITDRAAKTYFAIAGAVAVTVLVVLNEVVLGANILNHSHNLNIPFSALAAELRKSGFHRGSIVADGFFLGGNMKLHFPDSAVFVTGPEGNAHSIQPPGLIIWRDQASAFMTSAVKLFATTNTAPPRSIEIPCHNGPKQSEKFGFVLVAPESRGITPAPPSSAAPGSDAARIPTRQDQSVPPESAAYNSQSP